MPSDVTVLQILPSVPLLVLCLPFLTFAMEAKLAINTVQLQTESRPLKIKRLDYSDISKIEVTPKYAAFIAESQIWLKMPGKNFTTLSQFVSLPTQANSFGTGLARDSLIVSLYHYDEIQKKKDAAQPRGGFVKGPDPVGILEVSFNPPNASVIKDLQVVSKPKTEIEDIPSRYTPFSQSMAADGDKILAGAYGVLQRLDLRKGTTQIINFDEGLETSRPSLHVDSNGYWVLLDAGGMDGVWVAYIPTQGREETFPFSAEVNPSRLIGYRNRIFLSSGAGLLEISREGKTITYYPTHKDTAKKAVYGLVEAQGSLWATTGDHLIRYDLEKKSATLYSIPGASKDNPILTVGHVENKWYVSTKKFLAELVDF